MTRRTASSLSASAKANPKSQRSNHSKGVTPDSRPSSAKSPYASSHHPRTGTGTGTGRRSHPSVPRIQLEKLKADQKGKPQASLPNRASSRTSRKPPLPSTRASGKSPPSSGRAPKNGTGTDTAKAMTPRKAATPRGSSLAERSGANKSTPRQTSGKEGLTSRAPTPASTPVGQISKSLLASARSTKIDTTTHHLHEPQVSSSSANRNASTAHSGPKAATESTGLKIGNTPRMVPPSRQGSIASSHMDSSAMWGVLQGTGEAA